jgi:ABC-2 type transport system permease protein
MRNAFLVAAREYADNARTKGFWIGILMVPLILVGAVFVIGWLESDATPTRHYVVVDQSVAYDGAIQQRMDLRYAAGAFRDFQTWVQRNLKEEFKTETEMDFESMPAMSMEDFDPDAFLDDFIESNPEQFRALLEPGGFEALVGLSRPLLTEDAGDFEIPRRLFRRVDLPIDLDLAGSSADEIAELLKPYLRGDELIEVDEKSVELFAALIIPPQVDQQFDPNENQEPTVAETEGDESDGETEGEADALPAIQYWSKNLADSDLHNQLRNSLDRELRQSQFVKRGMDLGLVSEVQGMSFTIKKLDPDKAVGEEEVSQADVLRENAPIGFVYILWISIMQVASMLLNNTIEEKSNRIIEVLLSSVTPWELMAGKLLGIAGIGLTILMTWIASVAFMLWYFATPEAVMISNLASVIFDSTLLPAFVFYFLLGYLMYASIFLAIGSICNTLKEAQNFMGPVMMIMMVPIFTMMFIPKDPHGTLATILSWIPLYTPFVMMNRAAANPPAFDLYGTAIMLVFANIAMLWLCGRIFRIGILRTGQPPRLKELFGWLKRGN